MQEGGGVAEVLPKGPDHSPTRRDLSQIAVFIIGERHGGLDEDARSVSHRELLAAREEGLPVVVNFFTM